MFNTYIRSYCKNVHYTVTYRGGIPAKCLSLERPTRAKNRSKRARAPFSNSGNGERTRGCVPAGLALAPRTLYPPGVSAEPAGEEKRERERERESDGI